MIFDQNYYILFHWKSNCVLIKPVCVKQTALKVVSEKPVFMTILALNVIPKTIAKKRSSMIGLEVIQQITHFNVPQKPIVNVNFSKRTNPSVTIN